MAKIKLALYWASGCGGCDVAVLDAKEKIFDIDRVAEIVLWPMVLDFKYDRVFEMADKSIDLCLFNGAIRNSDDFAKARLLRMKARVLVAFGACACSGGIAGLANFHDRAGIFDRLYLEPPSNDNAKGTLPEEITRIDGGELELPAFFDTVLTLGQVVPVEYSVPGCPPSVNVIPDLVNNLAEGQPPPEGVLAPGKTLCDECDRVKEEKHVTRIWRTHQVIPDSRKCLLEQGLICMGPATRGGCDQGCLKANMPCRGCFGPPADVIDQGAKMLSAMASIFSGKGVEDVPRFVSEVVDPAGTFYRFGLADSIMKRKRLAPRDD